MLTEQECSQVTSFKVIKAFTIADDDFQLWHLAAIQARVFWQVFSPNPENDGGRKGEISLTHLSSGCSSFLQKYWKFHVLPPWYLILAAVLQTATGNWAAREAWLLCLLPPPLPRTTNGCSFTELCLSKALEMVAGICFPFRQVSIADWLLAAPASPPEKAVEHSTCSSTSYLHSSGVTE